MAPCVGRAAPPRPAAGQRAAGAPAGAGRRGAAADGAAAVGGGGGGRPPGAGGAAGPGRAGAAAPVTGRPARCDGIGGGSPPSQGDPGQNFSSPALCAGDFATVPETKVLSKRFVAKNSTSEITISDSRKFRRFPLCPPPQGGGWTPPQQGEVPEFPRVQNCDFRCGFLRNETFETYPFFFRHKAPGTPPQQGEGERVLAPLPPPCPQRKLSLTYAGTVPQFPVSFSP